MKGNDVNLKFNVNNMGKVSGLVRCLSRTSVNHTLLYSKMFSNCVETLMRGESLLQKVFKVPYTKKADNSFFCKINCKHKIMIKLNPNSNS